jgi:hypothetical protein
MNAESNHIEVYEPALCCQSGVCGTEVDPALVEFAADVEWAKQQGAHLERFNLAQTPMAFAENPIVRAFLERSGEGALPLVLVKGEFALAGRYPKRHELQHWCAMNTEQNTETASPPCCSGGGCS